MTLLHLLLDLLVKLERLDGIQKLGVVERPARLAGGRRPLWRERFAMSTPRSVEL